MPVMGGIEAARQIQARYVDKPEHKPLIYFLSGDDMHDNREALAEIDYAAYFTRLTLEGEIKAILTRLRQLNKPARLQISRHSQREIQGE
jgi:CheY-like chemotaxis protein